VSLASVLLIALGLSMDAFSASVTTGAMRCRPGLRDAFLAAGYFGLFQAAMPFAGYLLSSGFSRYFEKYTGIIGFVILLVIGIKMIFESFRETGKEEQKQDHGTLLVLAVATSVDAFAVGIAFAAVQLSDMVSYVLCIGAVTFFMSFCGVFIGSRFSKLFTRADIAGGVILIFIGIKMLLN